MPKLTINTTPSQASRIAKAFGLRLNARDNDGNPRNATASEVKQQTIQFLKGVVYAHERQAKIDAMTVPDINPT